MFKELIIRATFWLKVIANIAIIFVIRSFFLLLLDNIDNNTDI